MKSTRICILFLAFIRCFPWLDLLIWFIVSCLASFSSVLFLFSIADQAFCVHDFLFMRRRAGRVMMLLRYGSDVKFEIDDGVDDVDVGVDTNVVVFDVDAGADAVHRF